MEGPPFSIDENAVSQLYSDAYQCEQLQAQLLEKGMKGQVDAQECVWLLTPINAAQT